MRPAGGPAGGPRGPRPVVRFLEARWVAAAGLDEIGISHAGSRESAGGGTGHRRPDRAADYLAHRFHGDVLAGLSMQPLEHTAEDGRRGPELAVRGADVVDREDD